ncbi:alpha/beta fold hydrolase [Amycolatopsis sp. H20-H5]|uniref:alpha/beta fold hydrolase n=1 Tax=Amycolatopsis sp. H20-H5 TaxID=3046309 RepID=UPI002DBD1420|nr:alpha/beta fold hydrolase [Amycolatopsis sp. H20-H5]MEC3981325.1 alpha/beta fold hydrolase [Amycolatopsis sp. H20-H5]
MGEFAGSTGKIHYGQWAPAEPRGLVLFFHGLGEHIGSYDPLFEALTGAGFAVWAPDQLGHGRSEGTRVLIESVDDLLADAATLLDLAVAAHPGLPLVLAGHSLGSAVAALLAAERLRPTGVHPAGVVLCASSLVPVPAVEASLQALIDSGMDLMALRKDPGEMTRHTAYAQQIREDPLTWQGGIRRETLRALAEGRARLGAVVEAGTLDVPVLLLHGEEDDLARCRARTPPPRGCRTPAR